MPQCRFIEAMVAKPLFFIEATQEKPLSSQSYNYIINSYLLLLLQPRGYTWMRTAHRTSAQGRH